MFTSLWRGVLCANNKNRELLPWRVCSNFAILYDVWEDIVVNFIMDLPKFREYNFIFVVVDQLSKYGHFLLIKHPYSV